MKTIEGRELSAHIKRLSTQKKHWDRQAENLKSASCETETERRAFERLLDASCNASNEEEDEDLDETNDDNIPVSKSLEYVKSQATNSDIVEE